MDWNRWYATKSYLSSALWIVPLVALLLENLLIRIVFVLHESLDWVPWFGTTVTGATEALNTIEALTTAFVVFTFGSMLIVIQVASGQLTPRLIATTLLRNNVIRFTVGLFIFTMMFAVGTQARFDTTVPKFAVTIAWVLGIASIVAFLFLIDYTARLLRPVSIARRISEEGVKVLDNVYPEVFMAPSELHEPKAYGAVARTVGHPGRSAIVLAVNLKSLVALAQHAGGIIELAPRVGDFVATAEPLFRLHGAAARLDDGILRAQVAFGPERTIEQDSTFAFRVIVDIAIKALSPAINDPTTAVLAIDQLHRLLRLVGGRHLHGDVLSDSNGLPRLIVRTPNWEDFVTLAFSEIRLYGAANFQVARRLRAMIEDLSVVLPSARKSALRQELVLLDLAIEKHYQFPADLTLARQPDLQGLGGARHRAHEGSLP